MEYGGVGHDAVATVALIFFWVKPAFADSQPGCEGDGADHSGKQKRSPNTGTRRLGGKAGECSLVQVLYVPFGERIDVPTMDP
jgi:hypothetical protein